MKSPSSIIFFSLMVVVGFLTSPMQAQNEYWLNTFSSESNLYASDLLRSTDGGFFGTVFFNEGANYYGIFHSSASGAIDWFSRIIGAYYVPLVVAPASEGSCAFFTVDKSMSVIIIGMLDSEGVLTRKSAFRVADGQYLGVSAAVSYEGGWLAIGDTGTHEYSWIARFGPDTGLIWAYRYDGCLLGDVTVREDGRIWLSGMSADHNTQLMVIDGDGQFLWGSTYRACDEYGGFIYSRGSEIEFNQDGRIFLLEYRNFLPPIEYSYPFAALLEIDREGHLLSWRSFADPGYQFTTLWHHTLCWISYQSYPADEWVSIACMLEQEDLPRKLYLDPTQSIRSAVHAKPGEMYFLGQTVKSEMPYDLDMTLGKYPTGSFQGLCGGEWRTIEPGVSLYYEVSSMQLAPIPLALTAIQIQLTLQGVSYDFSTCEWGSSHQRPLSKP